jgi:hypothetical protein
MGLLDVDHVGRRAILEFLVNLIQLGNLPAKWWSGVAAKDQHYRFHAEM